MGSKVYIDTSVINGLIADDAPDIQAKTKLFFQRVRKGEFDLYVSKLVRDEIEATPDLIRRALLLGIFSNYPFRFLEPMPLTLELAELYLKKGALPAKSYADALHIAYAASHRIEILVSWNFKHIVKHKTRLLTAQINTQKGLSMVDLCSPEEL